MKRNIGYMIAICDDDSSYIDYMQGLIKELFSGKAEFYIYHSGEELLDDVDVMHDAVFLDIQMHGIDGTETARVLRETNKRAVLAFCSGAVNPTPESIKMTPYRYILKQYDDERIRKDVSEILDKMTKSYKEEYVVVESPDEVMRIYINDIIYITKAKYGSKVHLIEPSKYGDKRAFFSPKHLKELHKSLVNCGFEFAHDSYLVNCRWVNEFGKTFLKLENGEELNIARSKHLDFQKTFMRFWDKYEQ